MDGTDRTEDRTTCTRRLILNPVSGHGNHVARINQLADEYGFPVHETQRREHAIKLARQTAADDVDLLAVCGGDGTLHEVVQGLYAAEVLGSVTLCVIPVGTANLIATELGIESITEGFEVAERGEIRQLDLGVAGDEPFVLSAIAGLPADVSAAATSDLKQQFGSLAFVIGAIQENLAFDGFRVEVNAVSSDAEMEWSGKALAVLVGNVRRFGKTGGQANAEDGLLELAIVKQMPPSGLITEAIEQRLLHQETPHVSNLQAATVKIASLDEGPITFSLDGEIRTLETIELRVAPQSLRIRVGPEYDPNPA